MSSFISMPHIKSLDGLRGLAVLAVILFHLGWLAPGWIGVQVFFVLSGFLITRILLQEKERSLSDYLSRFYWRRSLRIFPLYFSFLGAVTLLYYITGEPSSLARDWPFLLSYTTNLARLRTLDVGPAFVHLWSLAVEEQFYLVWPFVVYFSPPALFKRIVIAILILSPILRLLFYFAMQGDDLDWIGRNIYCLPFSQFDAFAAGAAIVLWNLQDLRNAGRWLLFVVLLTGICGAGVLAHEHLAFKAAMKWSFGYSMYLLPAFEFVWGYTILNLLSSLILIGALQQIPVFRFLEINLITGLGTVSYGVYVFHVPLLILLSQMHLPPVIMVLAYFGLIAVVSKASYRYLETPFLRLKKGRRSPVPVKVPVQG